MTVLDILIAPHPTLKAKAKPVETIDDGLRQLLDDMLETMYDAPGIGLAANQIGELQRVLVMDCGSRSEDEAPRPMKIINPQITGISEEMSSYEEGCLSIPGVNGDVLRSTGVQLQAQIVGGETVNLPCGGLLARCLMHEQDHLDGKLFVDYLSSKQLKPHRARMKQLTDYTTRLLAERAK